MTTEPAIQIPLLTPQPPESLPTDVGHYVAVLQTKSGERDALENVSPATWERLMPLVELVGPKHPEPVLTAAWPREWSRRLSRCLGRRPFYFDILRLSASHPVDVKPAREPILPLLYAWARKREMEFVPVIHVVGRAAKHVRYVADAGLQDARGVALRYRIRAAVLSAGMRHCDVLGEQLADLGVGVADADLLLDLGFLDPDDEIDAEDIASVIRDVCDVGAWRCLVLLGTSIPKGLGAVKEGTVGAIPRREWELWSRVRTCELPRIPAFGDYAIQNPDPPAENIGGNVMRANIRYTTATETVIARGRGPVSQEGSEQYHDLCELIVKHPLFEDPAFSWGDAQIAACAKGLRDPGPQATWRGAGTSHHLRFVTDQVRVLGP
ncbi:MAG TPA: hypothetical protein VKV21_02820 [Solirubrobacteraceae bacterium]|nr:hypothetical protein [Solirubrobacteraceae bacterium]